MVVLFCKIIQKLYDSYRVPVRWCFQNILLILHEIIKHGYCSFLKSFLGWAIKRILMYMYLYSIASFEEVVVYIGKMGLCHHFYLQNHFYYSSVKI